MFNMILRYEQMEADSDVKNKDKLKVTYFPI